MSFSNPFDLALALRAAMQPDTSELPDLIAEGAPLSTGHCHVIALNLYWSFGGRILKGIAGPHRRLHFWNEIGGITVDATRDQFETNVVIVGVEDAMQDTYPEVTFAKAVLLRGRTTEIPSTVIELREQANRYGLLARERFRIAGPGDPQGQTLWNAADALDVRAEELARR